jgi:2-polyprenyl-3-methyl-5-hydroxy-6-metoxy-1,4-benzoquinol methylase
VNCKICQQEATTFGESTILGKYQASYFRCPVCGFIQVADPTWLKEAYSHAISKLDVGIMQRNLANVDITCAAIRLFAPNSKLFLDYGGGHGTFVRMMRDRGFDFRWSDAFAQNLHARGFEHCEGTRYDLLTSFEVLEHLENPLAEISAMMSFADNVLVSTLVLPEPPPQPDQWWYYALKGGQHISLYSHATLEVIARQFGRHLVSDGLFHLFSRSCKSGAMFRLATRPKVAKLISAVAKRPTLTDQDFSKFAD